MTTNCMSRSPRQSSRGLHQPPRLLLLTVPVPALSLWGWHVVALIFMAPTAEGGKFADSYPMSSMPGNCQGKWLSVSVLTLFRRCGIARPVQRPADTHGASDLLFP